MRQFSKFSTAFSRVKELSAGSCFRVVICSLFFLICANTTQAKGFFFFSWGQEIYQVKELPKDYTIQTEEHGRTHVNLGVIYNEFSIFWIPIWNWDVDTYVLLPDNYDTLEKGSYVFYNIDNEQLREIRQKVGDLSDKPELSFWRSIGGKLLVAFLLLFLCGIFTPSTNEKEINTKENE
ncbi:MAG: hypothetical protein J6N73_04035 [Prevotella sp.]|nr:hypothetical protein [Prevotella sp.]